MKNSFISIVLLFFFLSVYSCTKEVSTTNYPDSIFGHWDIEGGGTLLFEEGSFSASAGCNSLFGSVTTTDELLTFSFIASTLIGCPEAEGKREQELVALLDKAVLTYRLEENSAQLFNDEGEVVLSLMRPENANLVNAWTVVSIRIPNAISASILDADTGLVFLADGTVSIQTACNSGGGRYTTQEDGLLLTELFYTERACEAERNTREQEFSQALSQINNYSILRNTLSLKKESETWLSLRLKE